MKAQVLALCALAAPGAASKYMKCGGGVELCGVITLESGSGRSEYHHSIPVVHGLWPQTAPYGSSQCVAPQNRTSPSAIPSCYKTDTGVNPQHQLSFVQHEWTKHGVCAGTQDSADFFAQLCGLVSAPIAEMTKVKKSGGKLADMAKALTAAGYPVWEVDSSGSADQQLQLSACAKNGKWVLAAVGQDMVAKCGGGPIPPPVPAPPAPTSCQTGQRGPACKSDSDCTNKPHCIRCAHSGYCTDVPLFVANKKEQRF
eukprot:TRINITY_DN847_c0_g1_i1.p1 TRINITY_DN847_c0_g1~~TRINITY_DN847_c0_g1_i1.p1  ORF type:complete len:256 (+),score=81.85 TRINITY_DN847_c0_g1_i1:61-828(+)